MKKFIALLLSLVFAAGPAFGAAMAGVPPWQYNGTPNAGEIWVYQSGGFWMNAPLSPGSWSGLTTNGLIQAVNATTIQSTLSPPGAFAFDGTVTLGGVTLAAKTNALAPRQGLVFDGTAGAQWGGFTAGAGDFTVVAFGFNSDLTTDHAIVLGSNTGGLFFRTDQTTGLLHAGIGGGRDWVSTSGITLNQAAMIGYSRSGTTGTFWLNGKTGGSVVDTNNYTTASNLIGSYSGNIQVWRGALYVLVYNRALSAAEVKALYETGAPAAADRPATKAGTVLNGIAWSASSSPFTTHTSETTTGFSATSSGGSNQYEVLPAFAVKTGDVIQFAYTLTVNSGVNAPSVIIVDPGSSDASATYPLTAGTHTLAITATKATASAQLAVFNGGVSQDFTLSAAVPMVLGLLVEPESNAPGNGLVWNDMSGNGAHIVLPASGVTWVLPGNTPNVLRGSTSTNGNQQLLGATTLVANTQITRIRARSLSGTPAITLGTTSGGNDIVASVTLSTTWKDLTIALTGGIISSNASVWVGSNTTDTVQVNLATAPLSP